MRNGRLFAIIGLGAAMLAVGAGTAQKATPPRARYVLDVTTATGMPGKNVMAMMFKRGGGGSPPTHELVLRLGSTLAPTGGAAQADHLMPAGMLLGPSVALATPVPVTGRPTSGPEGVPQGVQRPKGRLLLYWGCGAHVGPGQPIVIDFAKVSEGQFPPNLFSASVPVEAGPTAGNARTYGSWPNAIDRKKQEVPAGASLIGEHRIASNYAPAIDFTLTQDFMPALIARAAAGADGTLGLSWNSVANATGYYAWAVGAQANGGGGGDMVWWSSSARQEFGAGLWDWLAPATVARLVTQRVVLPPSQTSCAIPAEVKQAAGPALISFLYAYGPEASFAYPPKPANPRAPWIVEWTAKARYRSTAMIFPGLGTMMQGANGSESSTDATGKPKKKCKPSVGGIMGGMLGRKILGGAANDCR